MLTILAAGPAPETAGNMHQGTLIRSPGRVIYSPSMSAPRLRSRARISELMAMLAVNGDGPGFESPAQHLPEIQETIRKNADLRNRIAMLGILSAELDAADFDGSSDRSARINDTETAPRRPE